MGVAVIFPGQGSQKPGMGKELAEGRPEAQRVYEEVSDATGLDVQKLCWEADEPTLRQTENAQIALFTTGLAAYYALKSHSNYCTIDAVAGHSVGEYAALVAAEVYTLADGAKLVQARGELMAKAAQKHPGAMAAVLGLDAGILSDICEAEPGTVVVANDNSPGQIVISGTVEGVAQAGQMAVAAGAKRIIALNVSGAFHSPLMREASEEMRSVLDATNVRSGKIPVYANVTGRFEPEVNWAELLELQLRGRVRWTETVQNMILDGHNVFIECGIGQVLRGLIGRIDRDAQCLKVNDIESLTSTWAALGWDEA